MSRHSESNISLNFFMGERTEALDVGRTFGIALELLSKAIGN